MKKSLTANIAFVRAAIIAIAIIYTLIANA